MITYSFSFYAVLCCFICSISISSTAIIVCNRKFAFKPALFVGLLNLAWSALVVWIGNADSPLKLPLMILILLAQCYILGMRGRQLLLKTFITLLCSFGGDVLAGLVMFALFDADYIAAARGMDGTPALTMQLVVSFGMLLLAALYRVGSHLLHQQFRRHRIGYLLRPLALLLIVSALFVRAMLSLSGGDQTERLKHVLPDFVIILVLLGVGVTYIIQDIRFYQQYKELQQLSHQKSLQALLLEDTRIFRHNVANMLYGMQGTLLSGDLSSIKSYYEQMAADCQLINNENVLALKRLPSLAVNTLLLNKLKTAKELRIPFFITVEEDVQWCAVRDSDMTQLLGILLDNALEAATESTAPYVAFEVKMHHHALSIIIRNTYHGNPPVFRASQPSTKPGHEGVGLRSVDAIVHRNRRILFNIYPIGRYVEASLLCY